MPRTLLELVQAAANEIGIPAPPFLFGSQNDQEKQLLALANREGKDFSAMANKNGGWQELRTDYTFTTVPAQVDYALPADFEYFVQKTFWDNQFKWSLIGPISAQEKQILRYGVVASGPRNKFYIRSNKMWLDPVPESAFIIAYDYYSNHWCQSSGGTTQALWADDTDTYRLDEDCFIQGMKWRFLRAKGLDYSEEFKNYEDDCERVMSRDGGSRDLPMGGSDFGQQFLDGANVPETNYGQ